MYEEQIEEGTEEEQDFSTKMKKISAVVFDPEIRTVLTIVLLLIMNPNISSAFNYYLTEKLHFDPNLMGRISFLSSIAYIIGILMMNTVLAGADFKSFYAVTTLFTAAMSSTSLILIYRLNIKYGISDQFFCLSNSALTTFISELNFLPILAFTCRLCPKGLEGSTYAVFTAIMNFAYNFSLLFGSLLIWAYHVTKSDFTNLWKLVVIQVSYSLFFGIIIFFLKFPDNGQETVEDGLEDAEENEGLVNYREFKRDNTVDEDVKKNRYQKSIFLLSGSIGSMNFASPRP